MKYICKNGKIYGIASNNWDDLSNHPSINSTLLDQAKDYTTDELNIIKGPMSLEEYNAIDPKNPNTIYVVSTDTSTPLEQVNYLDLQNKPLINGVVLTGDKSLASLSIYSILQIDNLMASLRAIKVVATKPSTSEIIPNTQYYVGTTTPYHVYLYDSNKNEIDLGTSEVQQIQAGSGLTLTNGVMDHSNNISPKTNTKIAGFSYDGQGHITGKGSEYDISTALSLSSTDLQIPTNKTIFDKTPQASLTHLQAGDLTTMDDFFSLLLEAEDTTYVTSTKVRTGFGYVTLPQFIINDLTAIGLENTGYGNTFFKAQKVKSTADVLYGYIELQYLYGFSSAINVKNSTGWSGWKLKQCDSFAPRNSVNAIRYAIIHVDQAVFNFTNQNTTSGYRQYEQKMYSIGQMTDPITNATVYGPLRVEQSVVLTYQVRITQTITSDFHNSGAGMEGKTQKVFRRVGVLTSTVDNTFLLNPYTNRASIVWGEWYPVEYPNIAITLNQEVVNSNSRADLAVSGGIATIRFNNLSFKSSIGTSATMFDSDTRLSILRINKYQIASTAGSYVWNVLISTDPTKTILVCCNPQFYAWGATANVGYYGLITIPLGY